MFSYSEICLGFWQGAPNMVGASEQTWEAGNGCTICLIDESHATLRSQV
jgi:hypothetical protein